MDINKLVKDTLHESTTGVPVYHQRYPGSEPGAETYITFFEYLQKEEQACDDETSVNGHYVQIDIWSKSDDFELTERVKTLLKAAYFSRREEQDLYEHETKIYHKCLRYVYFEEVQHDK